MSSRVNAFDTGLNRLIFDDAPAPSVTSWNGLTGAVKGTLAEIFAFGVGDDPVADNVWTMPNGIRRFRSTAAGGAGTLVNDGFFEDPSEPADGRVAAWITRRTQVRGESSTFEANTVYNAAYAGSLIDGTEWIAHKGFLTSDLDTEHQAGDLFWQQTYYGASFFGNQPLSIPDAGGAGGTVAYLTDFLFAHGNVTIGTREARQLSGWGQEIVYPLAQRHGITPGFVSVWTDSNIAGADQPGDGTGLWLMYGDTSHQDPGRVRGAFEAHMMTTNPDDDWGLGLWTRDRLTGPYQLVEFNADVGMALTRGGVQLPNVDSTTTPVGSAQTGKLIWDNTLAKVMISPNGAPYQTIPTLDAGSQLYDSFVYAKVDITTGALHTQMPTKPGYYFLGVRYITYLVSATGTATGSCVWSLGNNANHDNCILSQTIFAATLNTAVSQGLPQAVSVSNATSSLALTDAAAQISLRITTGATGFSAAAMTFVVSGVWVAI